MQTQAEWEADRRAEVTTEKGPHANARQIERKERQARWAGMNRHERRAAQALAKRSR